MEIKRYCPDGGTCHHSCADNATCARTKMAGPLSGTRPDNEWNLTEPPLVGDEQIPLDDPRIFAMANFCVEWEVKHNADCNIVEFCADLLRLALAQPQGDSDG